MTRYRVAVIGCGKVGALYEREAGRPKPASHAGAAVRDPRTELVALADTSPTALARAKKLFPRARAYSSASECLQTERPDIAVIATPVSARLSLVRLCLRYGVRAIICEKPLASSAVEAAKITRAVERSDAAFVLNYPRRFAPLFSRVRRAITSGALGAVQQVTCYYSNGLYNNGGHAIDSLLYLLGEDMKVRWAAVNKRAAHPPGDPCMDATLETKKGARVMLQSVDQKAYGIFDIRLFGTKGERSFIDYGTTLIEAAPRRSFFKEVRQLDRARARVHTSPEGNVLAETLKALAKKERPNGAKQGFTVLRTLDAIRHAAKKK
ncbi:TPA: hypothetical protein DIV48_01240 [Candidatus Kaiserbacteria bacterium]|nr:MAG: hypothetical protein UY93_C0002G0040 [Parcubacteria group bacterium GW2011_GWA1_56_13]HCR52256.1 hypothetical protein [Candidatus Kaiserbacteria bacterium]